MNAEHRGTCLSWTTRNAVLEVALHHAPCNEIGTGLLVELKQLVKAIKQKSTPIRAMLLFSQLESGFCAGADLRELYAKRMERKHSGIRPEESVRELRAFLDDVHETFDELDRLPFVTIAAVHGPVFGGGLELALVCDVIIADASARFCFPELRLGLVPGFGGIPRLRRDIGNAIIRDLMFTGRSLNAQRAYELGLVSQRVKKGEAMAAAKALVAQVSRFDQATVAAAKAFVKPLPHEELAQEKALFCELFLSPTVEKALADFVTRKDLRSYLP